MTPPRFTQADAERAHDAWHCNCGPAALAAIMDFTLDEARICVRGFEKKGYTNPTLMLDALARASARFRVTVNPNMEGRASPWPDYGLARIQWEGPWTEPGAPPRWRYRQTHWVGADRRNNAVAVFDINALGNGSGWVPLATWVGMMVPHLIALYPRANGKWHITHAIDVKRPMARDLRMAG